MAKYFLYDYDGAIFKIFSGSHFITILIIALINVLLITWVKRAKSEILEKRIRYTLAAILLLQELSLNIWRISWGQWRMGSSLPLHLCGVAVILSAIMLINKNFKLYEIVYFWGLGGAIQAIMQPDIGIYGFPHYRYYQFFVSHGSIVTASIFATFIFGYRPKFKSVFKIFLYTNLYMIFIAGFNYLTDGNYLFICHKPETASLIDFFGPWPWYIIPLEIVALLSYLIYYAPFGVKDLMQRKQARRMEVEG